MKNKNKIKLLGLIVLVAVSGFAMADGRVGDAEIALNGRWDIVYERTRFTPNAPALVIGGLWYRFEDGRYYGAPGLGSGTFTVGGSTITFTTAAGQTFSGQILDANTIEVSDLTMSGMFIRTYVRRQN